MTTTAAESTPQARVYYTEGRIRAADLVDGDGLMVNGRWREVLDVWKDGDFDAATAMYSDPTCAERELIADHLGSFSQYVVVRLLEESTEDLGDMKTFATAFRMVDLVTVQVPVG